MRVSDQMRVCKVKVPQINVNDATANIVEWHVRERGRTKRGEPLLTMETSKAVTELESPEDGFVHILAAAGTEVEVGATVALIAPTLDALKDSSANLPKEESVRATERARRLAMQHGIDLASLKIPGIITERHVQELVAAKTETPGEAVQASSTLPPAARVVPLSRVQRAVARTVTDASREHVGAYLMGEADWSQAQARLEEISDQKGVFVSPVDLLVFHSARSLREFPHCNATLTDRGIHEFEAVNIGATVDVQDNLYVIVIPCADKLSLFEIAAKRQEYQLQLFRGNADPAFLEGGTFTVTLLDHPSLTWQIPIVFPNQAAILGAGGIKERLRIGEADKVVKHAVLGLSLSFDHRFVNGAYAARFLQDVASRIEKCQID
jgi:pyruvate/2-oxoglutarate dehydrogenase complex dihydrolipoamide acyltransferase (E2) component